MPDGNPSRGQPPETRSSYRVSIGDRTPLFEAVGAQWHPESALYPGSYLDLAPSTAIPSVTYVDTDRRVERYFANVQLVAEEVRQRSKRGSDADFEFIRSDYTKPLELARESFDLLISLYAGPVWDHCGQYLAPQGLLLANTSHGDASLAALDPALRLVAAVHHRDGRYRLDRDDLDRYLIPKDPTVADPEAIRRKGRGIGYTKTAFAYVCQAVGSGH